MNPIKKDIQIGNFNPGPELKAFVYQQLNEITPYLLPESQMGVFITKVGNKKKGAPDESDNDQFVVIFSMQTKEGTLEFSGGSENIYKAVSEAKESLVKQLNSVINAIHEGESDDIVVIH